MKGRCGRMSTIVTSQFSIASWKTAIGDFTNADAILAPSFTAGTGSNSKRVTYGVPKCTSIIDSTLRNQNPTHADNNVSAADLPNDWRSRSRMIPLGSIRSDIVAFRVFRVLFVSFRSLHFQRFRGQVVGYPAMPTHYYI